MVSPWTRVLLDKVNPQKADCNGRCVSVSNSSCGNPQALQGSSCWISEDRMELDTVNLPPALAQVLPGGTQSRCLGTPLGNVLFADRWSLTTQLYSANG